MSDLVKRLRDFTKSEIVIIDAADRIEALEAALRQAREALIYHAEQTRPIHGTAQTIDTIDEALGKKKPSVEG